MELYLFSSFILVAAGCLAFYLGSSQQQLLREPLSAVYIRPLGALLLPVAFLVLSQVMQVAVSIFMVLIWAMVLLIVIPCIGALVASKRVRGEEHD